MPRDLSLDEFANEFGGGFQTQAPPVTYGDRLKGAFTDRLPGNLWGIAEALGSDFAGDMRRQNEIDYEAMRAEYARQNPDVPNSYKEVTGAGSAFKYAGGLLADSAPELLSAAATGGFGAVAGLSGAARAGLLAATQYPMALGDTLQNQRQESGRTSFGPAAFAAVPYVALDLLGLEGAAAGLRPFKAGVRALDGVSGAKGLAARSAATAGANFLGEGINEAGQEVMNQWSRMAVNPGASFTDPEALDRYAESFVGGGLLGAGVSTPLGGWRRSDSYQAPQAPANPVQDGVQRDLLSSPQSLGIYPQTRSLQSIINANTGVGQSYAGKGYADEIAAMLNAPTGTMVSGTDGIERPQTVGDLYGFTDAAAGAETGTAAANTAPANSVPPSQTALTDAEVHFADMGFSMPRRGTERHGILTNLYQSAVDTGIPLESDLLAPFWGQISSSKYYGKKNQSKLATLLQNAVAQSNAQAASPTSVVSQTVTPNVQAPQTQQTQAAVGQASGQASSAPQSAPAASAAAPAFQPAVGAELPSLTPNARVVKAAAPTVSAAPAEVVPGAPDAPASERVVKRKIRVAPGASPAAAFVSAEPAAAPNPQVETAQAGDLSEEDLTDIAEATGQGDLATALTREGKGEAPAEFVSMTDKDFLAVLDAAVAGSADPARDKTLIRGYLTAKKGVPHGKKELVKERFAERLGISVSQIEKVSNPRRLLEAANALGFSKEQWQDFTGDVPRAKSKAKSTVKAEEPEEGSETQDTREEYKQDKRELENTELSFGESTYTKEDTAPGVSEGSVKDEELLGGLALVGDGAGKYELDDSRDWTRAGGYKGGPLAQKYFVAFERLHELEQAVRDAEENGDTDFAVAVQIALDFQQEQVEELRAQLEAATKPTTTAAAAPADEVVKGIKDKFKANKLDPSKMETEELKVLRNEAARLKNAELEKKIVAELTARGEQVAAAPQATEPKAAPAAPKTTKAETKTAEAPVVSGQSLWQTLQQSVPDLASYEQLSDLERGYLTDLAARTNGKPVLGKELGLQELIKSKRAAAPTETTTAEQRAEAEVHAQELGGTVVWQEGKLALIRGYAALTGAPVYAVAIGSSRSRVDVEGFTGSALSAEDKARLVAVKKDLEAADAARHASDPFVKFDSNGLAFSAGVGSNLSGVVAGWKSLLGINKPIYVTTIEDARADKDKFTGPWRSVGSAALDANENGSMRKSGDGYYIAFKKDISTLRQLEVIAHELGHVHQRESFESAPAEVQKAIRAAHDAFVSENAKKSSREFVQALRARASGKVTKATAQQPASELSSYWKSFSEWYADQVAKWATTSEKPVGVVEQFFARLGAALKKFYYALKGQKYLPNETMKQFLDAIADKAIVINSKAVSNDQTSSQSLAISGGTTVTLTDKDGNSVALTTQPISVMEKFDTVRAAFDKYRSLGIGGVLDSVEQWAVTAQKGIKWDGAYTTIDGKRTLAFNLRTLVSSTVGEWTVHHEVAHALDAVTEEDGGTYSSNGVFNLRVLNGQVKPMGAIAVEAFDFYQNNKSDSVAKNLAYPFENVGTMPAQEMREELFAQLWAMYHDVDGRRSIEDNLPETAYFLEELINGLQQEAKNSAGSRSLQSSVSGPRKGEAGSQGQAPQTSRTEPGDRAVQAPQVFRALVAQGNIARLPQQLRSPVQVGVDALKDALTRGVDRVVFTSDLVDRAINAGLTSAGDFGKRLAKRNSEAHAFEREVEKIADGYYNLPKSEQGTGVGSALNFIYESTRTGKWGYGKYATPQMQSLFTQLSAESQKFIQAVFKHGDETLSKKKQYVLDYTASEYDARIQAAQQANDQKELDSLKTEKAATLAKFKTLFAINEGKPYAPLRRFGDWVVTVKSQEYLDAERNKDAKALKALETDPDHYYVDFAESKLAAQALQRQLEANNSGAAVEAFERDQVDQHIPMFDALTKLRSRLDSDVANGEQGAAKLRNIVSEMYLQNLADNSSRKAEMKRRGISGNIDMLRSFAEQGRADAQFLASVKHAQGIADIIQSMRTQAKGGNRLRRSEVFNELHARYMQSLSYKTPTFVRKLNFLTSAWFLATSPAYYLQNLTQVHMMSVPAMAGRHDYTAVNAEVLKAYGELKNVVTSGKLLKQAFDLSKVPADVRDVIEQLANEGKIDIGLESELGEFRAEGKGAVRDTVNRVTGAIRMAAQKVETVNRLSTAIAAYRLELAKTGDKTAAKDYAARIINSTHGDYTSFNAPRVFNTTGGKIALQFRKYQLIQLSYMVKLVNDAVTNPKERKAALKALGYTVGHTAVMAGVKGLPGFAAIAYVASLLLGDDDKDYDLEQAIRNAIGDNTLANLITRGAPTLAGVDMSGKVGMGNMLSVMPFSNADMSTTAGRYQALGEALGGASVGLIMREMEGLGLMLDGQWYRGLERMLPKGLADVMKSSREAAGGMTRRNGDVLLSAEEIGYWQSLMSGLGVPGVEKSVAYQRQQNAYNTEQKFQDRAKQIKNEYVAANRDGDPEAMAQARQAWTKLQDTRVNNGFKRQPLQDLFQAPAQQRKRESATAGGVQFNKQSRSYVENLI